MYKTLKEIEADHIVSIIEFTKGGVVAAAKLAGVPRSSMYKLLKKHRIDYQKIRFMHINANITEIGH